MKQIFCLAVLLLVPSAASAKSKLVARVDGRSIRRGEVTDLLWQLRGREAIETLVDRTLIQQEAKRLNIRPDTKSVDARIEAIKESLPKGTSLDARLKENGLTLKKLKDNIRFELLRDHAVVALARISVSSNEVRGAFETNREKLGVQEAVRLQHILVRTRREAEDLAIALKAGADFKKLAAAKSLDTDSGKRGGDLGFIARGMLRPEIEKVVLALAPGQVSGVVASSQGFHLFLAAGRREAEPAQYEKVAADLYRALLRRKIQTALPRVLAALRKKAKIKRFPL